MTNPITPPPELVQQWGHDANLSGVPYDDETGHWAYEQHIATLAAQWGADQELEACCKVLEVSDRNAREFLYSARRPKPPSLKELALEIIDDSIEGGPSRILFALDEIKTIRRALEALPND